MAKLFRFGNEALMCLKSGIDKLTQAVSSTLGPAGYNVIMKNKDSFAGPYSTKDGVTVAKQIALPDPFENLGVALVKEVAMKAVEVAGDGTTTAVVLAHAMFSEAIKSVISGMNPVGIKKGMMKALDFVEQQLKEMTITSVSDEQTLQIATVAANHDKKMGQVVVEAIKHIGGNGRIQVMKSKNEDIWVDIMEGLIFESACLSGYFINNRETLDVEFDKPYLLLCDHDAIETADLACFLSKVQQAGKFPLMILGGSLEGDELSLIVVNVTKGNLPIAAINVTTPGDTRLSLLEDMAAFTGATVISDKKGVYLDEVGIEVLGRAGRIRVGRNYGEIMNGHLDPDRVRERVAYLEERLKDFGGSQRDKDALELRLAAFTGGTAFIYVGASSDMVREEKKARMEDAAKASLCAVREGILPGGGTALAKIAYMLEQREKEKDEEEYFGVELVKKSLLAPLKKIAENCGKDGNVVAEKVKKDPRFYYGYNGLTDTYENLVDAGIIDSYLGVITSLKKAISVVSVMVTGDVLIVNKPQPLKKISERDPYRSLTKFNGPDSPLDLPPGVGGEWLD